MTPYELRDAAAEVATAEGWLDWIGELNGTWLPESDASRLANGDYRVITNARA